MIPIKGCKQDIVLGEYIINVLAHVPGFLSLQEGRREGYNEGVKRVLGDANQDKKLTIQFFSDCGAPSEDVMASNTTFDFVRLHFDRTST